MKIAPPGGRANSWEDVADLSTAFGLTLDPWQELVLQCAMAERADGRWTASRVGLSVPRQNGKSQLIVSRALAGSLLFGEKTVIVSAHQQDTARETFMKFMELIEANPALEARLSGGSIRTGIMNAFNREQIKFANGSVVKFKARSAPGGRGFSCDALFLDEAQILSARAWASINSTMSARPNPQVWLLGTPPTPEDDGDVFARARDSAMDGSSTRSAYLEWSADPADDPALEETRAKANPAWNSRINHDVVQGEYETYSPEQFARERLGIWDEDVLDVFAGAWPRCKGEPPTVPPVRLAVACDPDQSQGAILASAVDEDGIVHVRPLRYERGTGWLVEAAAELARELGTPVVVDGGGPAASLVPDLNAAGVPLRTLKTSEFLDACAEFHQLVMTQRLRHADYAELNDAVRVAVKRPVQDRWAWGRRKSAGDISLLEAATLATWDALHPLKTKTPTVHRWPATAGR
ncbi:hypothetical protein GCM10009718_33190 [Isoptericola halotolerans]|uniref:Terminase n=1 Tax=Isoptericola halotolerans TaxID=300560 RepID=A0ABX2A8Q1_9MICO|nr:hypothetical protein [Isoptericola halotolerans]NOV98207.1 hypothetical protein [Isoptericola halotolerans]